MVCRKGTEHHLPGGPVMEVYSLGSNMATMGEGNSGEAPWLPPPQQLLPGDETMLGAVVLALTKLRRGWLGLTQAVGIARVVGAAIVAL